MESALPEMQVAIAGMVTPPEEEKGFFSSIFGGGDDEDAAKTVFQIFMIYNW